MKTIRLLVSVFLFVAMVGILLPYASADQWDRETKFSCSEPVSVAGTVLQPGTYWFRLEESSSSRFLVVIKDQDRTHVVARVNAIANYRPKPEGSALFEYWDQAPGKTPALRSWFYPGDYIGFEFPLNL